LQASHLGLFCIVLIPFRGYRGRQKTAAGNSARVESRDGKRAWLQAAMELENVRGGWSTSVISHEFLRD